MKVPFYSDELFRYVHWRRAATKGWDRKIKYQLTEYREFFEKTTGLRERLQEESGELVRAVDLEKCAYALAKEAVQPKPYHAVVGSDDDAVRPPPSKRRKMASLELSQDPVSVCLRKGPDGSPTRDELGYELDYDYISKTRGHARDKRGFALFHARQRDGDRKAEIMGLDQVSFGAKWEAVGTDRVARDLGLAFHEVELEQYEEWRRRGFHLAPGEFDDISKEEIDRLARLQSGCAFRKGSKYGR